jgi:hypothetical protein
MATAAERSHASVGLRVWHALVTLRMIAIGSLNDVGVSGRFAADQ